MDFAREEMVRAEDLGAFYRIRPDGRDLNYDKFFSDGETFASVTAGSHRVERLEGGRVVDTRYVPIPSVPCTLRDLPELNCQ